MTQENSNQFICITECINTGHLEISEYPFTSLEDAKQWVSENCASDSYRNYNVSKIIEINSQGETQQVYTNKPESDGRWYEYY